jgi:hypothetical protein
MKNTFFTLVLFVLLTTSINAQTPGKVIIRNASDTYPLFMASMNGVRLDNEYVSTITFAYLDDNVFRLKIFQSGITKPLTFAVNAEANYVSQYMITKDEAGYFKLVLESKALDNGQINPVAPTVPATPATTFVSTGPQKVNDADYKGILDAIRKESFENTKLDLARNFFTTQAVSSDQVLGVIKLFAFENNKVTFAKFAYTKTLDKQNFYKVYEGLSFNNSKKELTEFIQKNP